MNMLTGTHLSHPLSTATRFVGSRGQSLPTSVKNTGHPRLDGTDRRIVKELSRAPEHGSREEIKDRVRSQIKRAMDERRIPFDLGLKPVFEKLALKAFLDHPIIKHTELKSIHFRPRLDRMLFTLRKVGDSFGIYDLD